MSNEAYTKSPKEGVMNFTAKDFTLGQMNALVKNLGGESVVRGILDGTTKFVVQAVEAGASLFNPDVFFRTRPGLWVSASFRDLVVAKAEPSATIRAFKHVALPRDMPDTEIEEMLGENHLFTETEVTVLIADLISKQEDGKEGELLNNGYANLFYTPSSVVIVHWNVDDREWNVDAWERDGYGWHAGYQVFSPAN